MGVGVMGGAVGEAVGVGGRVAVTTPTGEGMGSGVCSTPQPVLIRIPIKIRMGNALVITGQLYRKQKTALRRFM
jgi:hypothetical protein